MLGPDPDDRRSPASTSFRVGTLSKTLGSLGGFVAGPARYTDLLVNRARSYIFTTASTPADAAAALAALGDRALGRRRRACGPGCARTSTACVPVTRRRSCPYVLRRRGAHARGGRRAARRGAARPRDPPADGARPARRGCGSRSRPRTRRSRSTRSRARSTVSSPSRRADEPPPTSRVRQRDRHRGRQDVVGRRVARRAASAGDRRRARASRCSRASPGTPDRRRRARRRHRRAPRRCARRTAPIRWRGHRRWPRPSSGGPRSRPPTSRERSSGRQAPRSGWSRVSAGPARRSRRRRQRRPRTTA